MHKLMFACSRCGFKAFVERPMELELAGWSAETRHDGTSVIVCSACLSDAGEAAPVRTATTAALTRAHSS